MNPGRLDSKRDETPRPPLHGGLVTVLLLVAAFFPANVAAESQPDAPPIAEFAVGRSGRPLLVPVAVAGEEFLFCVDTGASKTTFDVRLRHMLGRPTGEAILRTSAGVAPVETFACPEARLGRLDLQVVGTVVCCDLRPVRLATGEAVDGILGMDFLRQFAAEIDFDRGRLRLWEHAPQAWRAEGGTLPLVICGEGVPCTYISLPRARRQAVLVDTGANACSLHPDAFDALLAEGQLLPGGGSRAVTIAGEVRSRSGFVRRVAAGPFVHELLRFDRDPVAALGLRYLARYVVRLDPQGERMCLVPGAGYREPERTATSGLAVVAIEGKKIVHAVEPGSAAADAGVRPGDVIIRVEGRDANEFDLFALGEILTSEAGRVVRVRLLRSDGEIEATLTLGDRWPGSDPPARTASATH